MYEVFKLIYYLFNTYLYYIENKNENESDSENNKLQTSDEKLNKNPPYKYVNNGFSNEIEQQLEEMHDNENKINDLLLKKINEFIKENKLLTEINKSSQIELNRLKTSMKNSQKYLELWKENYRLLQLNNKNLLDNLQNYNDVDYSEELPIDKRKSFTENNISSRSYCTVEGLLFI